MADIEFDDSDFQEKSEEFLQLIKQNTKKAVNDIATEILRLSGQIVPIYTPDVIGLKERDHTGGTLQDSGHIEPGDNEYEQIVGYNTVYAAYQHEGHRADGSHVITKHTNPRGQIKFLENPIRENLARFINYYKSLF